MAAIPPSTTFDSNDGDSVIVLGYDAEDSFASIATQLNNQIEPTPQTTDEDDERDGGGLVRRSNQFRTRLSPSMLEAMALTGMELAKAIERRARDLFRNKFPLLVPAFEKQCPTCGRTFDDAEIETCPDDDTELVGPDPAQRADAKAFFERVNKEGQSLSELYQSLAEDAGRLGGWVHVVRYNYGVLNGAVVREPLELVRGDSKRIRPVVDANGRIGGHWWACPIHRGELIKRSDYEDGHTHCRDCGAELREVYFGEAKTRSGDPEKVYFEDEVIDHAEFNERLDGHDWVSPVAHLWRRQAILEWMTSYAAAYYDDQNTNRYPGRMLILHTTNKNAVEKQLQEAQDERDEDPNATGVLYNEIPRDGSGGKGDAQVIDMMNEELMGQSPDLKKDFKSDIRSVYGQVDVQDSELEDAGGLNNEGLQLTVKNDDIASWQQSYREGPLSKLMRVLGFEDWRITFVPPEAPETDPDPAEVVQAAAQAEQAGVAYQIEDGHFSLADTNGVVEPEGQTPAPEEEEPAAFSEADTPDIPIALAREAVAQALADYDPAEAGEAASIMEAAHEELFGPFDPTESQGELVDDPAVIEQQIRNPTFASDRDVPEFAEQLVEDAVAGGAITKSERVSSRQHTILETIVADSLTQRQGWSLESIDRRAAPNVPDLSGAERQAVVRNYVQDVINAAVQLGYMIEGELDERRFYLAGPHHPNICEACEELLFETNPAYVGGEPVTLDELMDRVDALNQAHFPDHDTQGGHMHINCLHRISEHRDAREE